MNVTGLRCVERQLKYCSPTSYPIMSSSIMMCSSCGGMSYPMMSSSEGVEMHMLPCALCTAYICDSCDGLGERTVWMPMGKESKFEAQMLPCGCCAGTGKQAPPSSPSSAPPRPSSAPPRPSSAPPRPSSARPSSGVARLRNRIDAGEGRLMKRRRRDQH